MQSATLFFTLAFLMLGSQVSYSQQSLSISLFPGYHIINSDEASPSGDVSKTNFIYGGTVSTEINFGGYPVEITLGYSQGKSAIIGFDGRFGLDPNIYTVYLKYQQLPVEALLIHNTKNDMKILAGINIAGQYRTLIYDNIDIRNDRLSSFGIGLTGKIQKNFIEFDNGKGSFFGNLTASWTEYLIHNARGRNVDDFTLRHITIAPQLGFRWNLDSEKAPN